MCRVNIQKSRSKKQWTGVVHPMDLAVISKRDTQEAHRNDFRDLRRNTQGIISGICKSLRAFGSECSLPFRILLGMKRLKQGKALRNILMDYAIVNEYMDELTNQ